MEAEPKCFRNMSIARSRRPPNRGDGCAGLVFFATVRYWCFFCKKLDIDRFENLLSTLIMAKIDKVSVHRCTVRFETVNGADVCLVDVARSPKPVYASTDKGGGKFYVRVGNTTREYDTKETVEYVKDRWGLGNES